MEPRQTVDGPHAKGTAVYIRVIRVRNRPGKLDEMVERWREEFVPEMRRVSGFRRAYFGGDRFLNSVVVVTVWDDLPRATHWGPVLAEFEERSSDLLATPSVIEEFELLADIEAEP